MRGKVERLKVGLVVEPGRLRRAIHLDATPVDVGCFTVTGGAKAHTVNVVDGECRCDCFDAHVHGDGCKHSLLVRLLGGDEAVVLALREIMPDKDSPLTILPPLARVP